MTLDPKRARFVAEYRIDRNGAAAAIRAGYSKRRAKQTAHDLLECEDVKAAVAEVEAEVIADAVERGRDARARLEDIAFMDLGDGPLRAVPARLLSVVSRNCETLLKLDGKFTERVEHTGKDGGPIEVTDLEAARRIAFILTRATKDPS